MKVYKIGLVAEEFHEIFGRGTDDKINGNEVTMALWLAVQELSHNNQLLQEKLQDMQMQIKTLAPGLKTAE